MYLSTNRGARLTESAERLGQHPTGIITPICPEIYSFSFSAGVCQRWMEIFAAPIPFGSQSCSREAFIFYFLLFTVKTNLSASLTKEKKCYCISNKLTFILHKLVLFVKQGESQKCAFVFLSLILIFCFLGRFVGLELFFVVVVNLVFLPLLSLISTAAWASSSREISSLFPLRAAWCNGDNL